MAPFLYDAGMSKSQKITVWILGDQLLWPHPALSAAEKQTGASQIRVVLVESQFARRRYPYQRKKLVLLISAMRHYALELQERGYQVDLRRSNTFLQGLRQHVQTEQPPKVITMAASHYAGRQWQMHALSGRVLASRWSYSPTSSFWWKSTIPILTPHRTDATSWRTFTAACVAILTF